MVIIGAGGHGRDCHQLLDDLHADEAGRDLHLIGYVDDNPELTGQDVQGLPVLGGLDWLAGHNVAALMGIGYPRPRYLAQRRATELGVREWPTLVHPRAYVASRAVLGAGVHVAPMASIGPNAAVQDWAIVNVHSTIGHDSIVGEHVLIAGNVLLAGGCQIGEGAMIGSGATLQPCAFVGDWAEVGMGAVVTHPVPDYARAVGVPARVIGTTAQAAD